jgi:hypothetical protein
MTDFQTTLLKALSHLFPDGFDGFRLEKEIPPASYADYQDALLPGSDPLTELEITTAAQEWDAAAPLRNRERLAITRPQFRKMLRSQSVVVAGQAVRLKEAVETAIAAAQDPEAKADFEDWYADPPSQIRRTAPRIEQIRQVLGIAPEIADQWFEAAAAYE